MAIRCRTIQKSRTVFELYSASSRWIKGYMWGIRNPDVELNGEMPTYGFLGYSSRRRKPQANCFCLAGAINLIYKTQSKRKAAFVRVAEAINKRLAKHTLDTIGVKPLRTDPNVLDDVICDVIGWNDDTVRTYREIREVSKEARI
jgi:hypothetical protein